MPLISLQTVRPPSQSLQKRLDAIYRQAPDPHPADRAFADVAWRYAIPRALPEALIEGFAWDAEGRRYESLSDITAYAVRVAGTVGAMMSVIMQVRDPAAVARACDLGVAMQFTNIARDVGEDARNGRLYLPRQWLGDVGLDADEWLANPRHSPQLGSVIARLLAQADLLYARAATGVSLLPASCRPAIHASRLLYAGIGRQVERNSYDSVTRRAVVPRGHKLALLASALAASLAPVTRNADAPLDEARFIIEAVAAATPPKAHPRGLIERALWVAELFARLEKSRP